MSNDQTNPIRLAKDQIQSPDFSLTHEWILTNGIGGYASGTIAGANARHYHALLIASLLPPVERTVLLSKLDETLIVTEANGNSQTNALYCNNYEGSLQTEGLSHLEEFAVGAESVTWKWKLDSGVVIEKRVRMVPGWNASLIEYSLPEASNDLKVELNFRPLYAWRDHHSEMREVGSPPFKWDGTTLSVSPNNVQDGRDGRFEILLTTEHSKTESEPGFRSAPDWYRNFRHEIEAQRGLDCHESLFTPGELKAQLRAGESISFLASTAPALSFEEARKLIAEREQRIAAQAAPWDEPIRPLIAAAQSFLVARAGDKRTVIAGYPWFTDWGRDTMIALPGLCLAMEKLDVARGILLSFAEFIHEGLIPNRFPDSGAAPETNTADATLWFINAIHSYIDATGDWSILDADSLWEKLKEIAVRHRDGTLHGIGMDPTDHLLKAGEEGLQLTWMDAKVGDWVVTPRIGKPVEINALWINALRIFKLLADHRYDTAFANEFGKIADQAQDSFLRRFTRPDGLGLYDVIDTPNYHAPDTSIRPNQIFALSLPFAPLSAKSQIAQFILRLMETDLATPYGLRSLSPNCPGYIGHYGGGVRDRDGAYHQGTVWCWLQGPYAEAHYRIHGDAQAARLLLKPLIDSLPTQFAIGTLPEICDGDAPFRPNGCISQAWSVAETLRVWKLLS